MLSLRDKKLIDWFIGGLFYYILAPFVVLLGKILKRDHSLAPQGSIFIMKMIGGGSLIIAFPALLGIRSKFPKQRMVLVTSTSVAPFARLMGIFDEIILIEDSSVGALLRSSISALIRAFRCDTFIDLEVYSRLSSVFSIITMARNRIGFYLEHTFWRKIIFTHLIFFNRFGNAYYFYEQITRILNAIPASFEDCRQKIITTIHEPSNESVATKPGHSRKIGIGHSCSDLARERMLSVENWVLVTAERIKSNEDVEIVLLGGPGDLEFGAQLSAALKLAFVEIKITDATGSGTMEDTTRMMRGLTEFWGIDSGLLHVARVLHIPTVSYWGPTASQTLLKPNPNLAEEIYSREVPCSPCVHLTETPPCRGNNICIKGIFDPEYRKPEAHHNVTIWYPK